MRGAEIAGCAASRQSIRFITSCALQFMMRRPPLAPSEAQGRPSRERITGAMFESGVLPPATEFGRPGSGSNHIMPLLRSTPVPGVVTRLPHEREERLGAGDGHAVAVHHAEVGRRAVGHLASGARGGSALAT